MKITEKMLLDGYDGICADGTTAQSTINGNRIWWAYRHTHNDGANATEQRAEATHISLEYDRIGDIELEDGCAGHLAINQHYNAAHLIWGDQI